MGGSKTGGSMPLPRICGFDEGFFFGHKLTQEDEHKMSSMLGNRRFQKGNRAARCYANLVVLFRLLLFYSPLKHDARFWGWIATDWGIVEWDRDIVSSIANFYSDARYAALGREEKRLSLLVRLVDEWLLIRPPPELSHSETLDDTAILATRSKWLNIRDYHVDMLMDAKLSACLAGIEPPAKIVTSLWETDPEVAALLKEVKTTRRSKPFVNKFKPPPSASDRRQPTGSEVARKRKVSLSEGEIDESELTPTSNETIFDERSFTPHTDNDGTELTFSMQTDHPHKRTQFARRDHVSETYPTESGDAHDLIDLTPAPRRTPLPSYEQYKRPAAKPSPARESVELSNPKPAAPAPVQSKPSQWLRKVAGQTMRRREELHARAETETTGYVPFPGHRDDSDNPPVEVGGGLMASERDIYEARLHEMEGRMEALERALQHESSWARAMGQFLYDANGNSVKSLQDVFGAIDTLQKTMSALLEKPQQRE